MNITNKQDHKQDHNPNQNREPDAFSSDHNRALLTVEQAAAFLQVSASSIRSYIREGKLKAFRVAGLRKVLIARAELMKLLELVEVVEPA